VPQDVQSLIGKKLKAEEETSDENSFTTKDIPGPYRFIRPSEMSSLDYRPDRFLIYLDDNDVAVDVHYG